MPIMKMGRSKNGVIQLDTVDSGERVLSPSERAQLQMLEERKERESMEGKASQVLVHPKGVGEVDERDRTNDSAPRRDVVSVERIKEATGGSSVLTKPEQPKKPAPVDPEEMAIARMVESGLGEDPDVPEDTHVGNTPRPEPQDPKEITLVVGATECPICKDTAKNPAGLASHLRAKHPDTEIVKKEGE